MFVKGIIPGHKGNALYHSLEQYCRTVKGTEFVIECLQELRAAVEKTGGLTHAKLTEYKRYAHEPNAIVARLTKFRDWLEPNPENLPREELLARHLKDLLQYLDAQNAEFNKVIAARQEQMDVEDSIRRAAALLPPDEVMEKIVRYESASHRQLYRAINQLERLQRRRLGENVPPPVVIDVSTRG